MYIIYLVAIVSKVVQPVGSEGHVPHPLMFLGNHNPSTTLNQRCSPTKKFGSSAYENVTEFNLSISYILLHSYIAYA